MYRFDLFSVLRVVTITAKSAKILINLTLMPTWALHGVPHFWQSHNDQGMAV